MSSFDYLKLGSELLISAIIKGVSLFSHGKIPYSLK